MNIKILPEKFTSKNLFLLERDKELKQIMYALILGEHLFFQGEAGTAKSLMATNAFNLIENAKLFSIQMSEATLSEHLFGAYDIKTWKEKGYLKRDITNSILEADFAFIDEIFDGREDVLRTLLGVLNERKFSEGRQQEKAKLHTCIATANYQTINEKTIPILDRFLFKADIKPIASASNRIKMYKQYIAKEKNNNDDIIPILDINELLNLNKNLYSNKIKISSDILKSYDDFIKEFRKEIKNFKEKFISERTTNKLLDIARASALLDNRKEVNANDLYEIKYGLCVINDMNEENTFEIVFQRCIANIDEAKIELEKLENIEKSLKLEVFDMLDLQPNEYITHLHAIKTELANLKDFKCSTNNVEEAKNKLIEKLKTIHEKSKEKLFVKI